MLLQWTATAKVIFSANFACPICGYSMQELEPRLFSFNNPAGACGTCDGLGVQQYFDPSRVIQDETLSLAQGAIRGWDQKNYYYFQMLTALADHYDFDLHAPFNSLPKKTQDIILKGSGRTEVEFKYINDRGDIRVKRHPLKDPEHT